MLSRDSQQPHRHGTQILLATDALELGIGQQMADDQLVFLQRIAAADLAEEGALEHDFLLDVVKVQFPLHRRRVENERAGDVDGVDQVLVAVGRTHVVVDGQLGQGREDGREARQERDPSHPVVLVEVEVED